ncbi:MAG: hypothetical protein A2W25_13390 [candidate division Zixibacteria bacterium RBG_16_53_22]|nr:MAG: hypothetical protein A2W25_13390 [candidate division Zixibacteria bacterium RBG_16_53_22]
MEKEKSLKMSLQNTLPSRGIKRNWNGILENNRVLFLLINVGFRRPAVAGLHEPDLHFYPRVTEWR